MRKIILIYFTLLCIPFGIRSQSFERDLSKENWQFKNVKDKLWLSAKVPGTVYTDLFHNKKIPDPFLADNESKLQFIDNEDWVYKTSFLIGAKELRNEHIEMQFDGLDTYAKVFLNDSLILVPDNMFRKWVVDVRKQIHLGKNTIRIQFESAVNKGKKEASKLSYQLPGDEKVFTRKAQYQYGWDWGPRFVTCGIWKGVKLKCWNHAKINHVQFVHHKLDTDKAQVQFKVEIICNEESTYQLSAINSKNEKIGDTLIKLNEGINHIALPHLIKHPKLWWTHNLGKQHLYNYSFVLSLSNKKLDSIPLCFGLRNIEWVQEKDEKGKSFYMKLNGSPIFAKGANYIPEDNFLPRVTIAKTKQLIKDAKAANINMLRIWGGGTYGSDELYQLCNENGILIWQDFMFACAMYPGDSVFVNNVKAELNDQIVRLRNHPSLAIWCGNNEIDEGWKNWGWQKQYKYSAIDSSIIANNYHSLFEEQIKQAVQSLDGNRFYWPSSPSVGWGRKESLSQGDAHYWGVWWGMEPFEVYEKKVPRFMSEYGFQGMPALKTFEDIAAIKHHDNRFVVDSNVLKVHQKHPSGYQTIQSYMERDYKIPKSFENYVYVSQLLQADGMKTAMEAHRRAMPYCMGSLYWQLNDCWPVTSWSSMDYNGHWKALHYQVKKSFNDLSISFEDKNDSVLVFIVSDKLEKIEGKLKIKLMNFDGSILFLDSLETIVKSNASKVYYSIHKDKIEAFKNPRKIVQSAIFSYEKEDVQSLHYFVKPKELDLSKAAIKLKYISNKTIEITTDKLAKNVFLSSEDELVGFEDNYFDLLPNEKKIVKLNGKLHLNVKPKIKVKSLFDTWH
ncbi:MAG: glycoside hydrolase family 2 protein [Bacteroidota bacterium]